MAIFKVAHLNFNFQSGEEADLRALWRLLTREDVDILTLNEAKDRHIEALLTKLGIQHEFVVLQDRRTPALAGCAIIFRRSKFTKAGRFRRHLAIRAGRRRMLDRYVIDVRLRVRGTRKALRIAVGHNVPGWYADLQPLMDAVVWRIFRQTRVPVIFNTDANRRLRSRGFRGRTIRRFIGRLPVRAFGVRGGIDYILLERPVRLLHGYRRDYPGQNHPALIVKARLP